MRKGAFTYNSGISLGRGFKRPWIKVQDFLNSCTNCKGLTRAAIELVESVNVQPAFYAELQKEFNSKYSLYGYSRLGVDQLHQWVVPPEDIEQLIDYFEKKRPLPKYELGPLLLNLRFDFALLDSNGEILPYQEGINYGKFVSKDRKEEYLGFSRIDLYLSENSRQNLYLCLPFEEDNTELNRFLKFLYSKANFKINSKMWKKWSLTQKGNSYRKTKWEYRENVT